MSEVCLVGKQENYRVKLLSVKHVLPVERISGRGTSFCSRPAFHDLVAREVSLVVIPGSEEATVEPSTFC